MCRDCDLELVAARPNLLSAPIAGAPANDWSGRGVRNHRAFGETYTVSSAMTLIMKFFYPTV